MKIFNQFQPKAQFIPVIILTIIAIVGNAWHISPLFSVDILFGSIAALLTLVWFGTRAGLIVATVSSAYTIVLWSHGYAMLIFIGEIAAIAWQIHRAQCQQQPLPPLVIASVRYWIALGIPLTILSYRFALEIDWPQVILITLGLSLNGIFNAGIAGLLVVSNNLLRRQCRSVAITDLLFHSLLSATLLPTTLLAMWYSHHAMVTQELQLTHQLHRMTQQVIRTHQSVLSESTPITLLPIIQTWLNTLFTTNTQVSLQYLPVLPTNTSFSIGVLKLQLPQNRGWHSQIGGYQHATYLLYLTCPDPTRGIIEIRLSAVELIKNVQRTITQTLALLLLCVLGAIQLARWSSQSIAQELRMLITSAQTLPVATHHHLRWSAPTRLLFVEAEQLAQTLTAIAQTLIHNFQTLEHEHQETEAALLHLRQSEARWASAQRIANMGSWYLERATNQIQWSDQTYYLLGYHPEDIKPSWKHFIARIHPRDRRRLRLRVATLAQLNQDDIMIEEVRLVLPNQTERILLTQTRAHYVDNQLIGFEGILLDVTAREQITQALAIERQRLTNVIEGPRLGTWEWNVNTGETIFNEYWAAICGYQLVELTPLNIQTWRQLAHPDDLDISDILMDYHLRGYVDRYDCEVRMRHKDGYWVWVLDQGRIVARDAQGKPLVVAGTHVDITMRKRIELDLVRRESLERQLIDCAAELLTPSCNNIATAIDHTLAQISHLIGAERSYLGLMDYESQTLGLSYCWTAEGISQRPANLHQVQFGCLPNILKDLHHKKPVVISEVTTLAHEWTAEYHWLTAAGVQSLVLIPVCDSTELRGVIGFELINMAHVWRESDVRFLQVLGNLFANALSRERSDRALRASEQRLRAVFDTAPIGISVMDTEHRLIYINPAFADLVGREIKSLPGESIDNLVHPEDNEREHPLFAQLLAGQRTGYRLEKRYVRPNGDIVWGDLRVNLLPGHEHEPPLPLGMVEDITELREAMAHRRHLEQQVTRYTTHLEQLVDISAGQLPIEEEILALIRFGCACFHAHAGHLGRFDTKVGYQPLVAVAMHSYDETNNKQLAELPVQLFDERIQLLCKTPCAPQLLLAPMLPTIAQQLGYHACIILVIPEIGSEPTAGMQNILALWSRQPRNYLERLDGQLLRLIAQRIAAVCYDQRVQQDLVAAKERETIGHFASGIAHDFNNLLSAIDANLHFIDNTIQQAAMATADDDNYASATEELIEVVNETRSAVGHAKVMTSGLLSLSRAGGITLESVVLLPLLNELTAILRQILPSSIALTMTVEPDLCVYSNGAFLQAALLNLALNARDAMTHGGELIITAYAATTPPIAVRIGSAPNGEHIVIRVRDTGYGMSAAVLARIFEPLFSTKARQRGHGLGLFMVQEFITRTRAALDLESQPEQGTTFYLLLPPARSYAIDSTDDNAPLMTNLGHLSLRLLLVDDDARVRDSLERLLTAAGFRVTVAIHGAAALEVLQTQPAFDLVLSDIAMPVMDGVKLVRQLTQARPELPVILMTGRESGSEFQQDLGEHPPILNKPLDMQVLYATIQQRLHLAM
ncbi:PAS domain S-box protein [Thiospirillum jenense]|uniref:histidine kinase n=1 Tax=Thiospirillum jenense TaxID=1653858 RepID=A0A839HLQ9_9GAMM|nr:PAS domain S-box protein [Thiospirillum jenense]MBB1126572.1 PAS domain S-box protein [Thiospirillum jenense]